MTDPAATRTRPAATRPASLSAREAGIDDVIHAYSWTRRPRTLPEQIADDISRRILEGEFAAEERMGEVELAARYGVSRGPVREAIRELEKRGLVEIFPRRGAFVARIDNDTVSDTFNIRAVLLGLAARYAAELRDPGGLAEIEDRVRRLEKLAEDPQADSLACSLASARVGAAVGRASDSQLIKSMLVAFAEGTLWALIWREHQVDYLTRARRREGAQAWRAVLNLIHAGEAGAAETAVRELLHDNRDETLAHFSIPGAPPPDPRRKVRLSGDAKDGAEDGGRR